MSQETSIQLFENAKIRVVWDDQEEKYYFSIVDVIQVLTESSMAKRYWTDLKRRLKEEGADETYAKIVRLKMPAPDGKMRETDAAEYAGCQRRRRRCKCSSQSVRGDHRRKCHFFEQGN